MAVTCWVPECNHNNYRETCKFYRFPCNLTKLRRWLQLIRRDGKPGTGARVCSCHFLDGKKDNDPEIFEHNKDKLFKVNYLTPEKKKKRSEVNIKFELSHEDNEGPSKEVNPESSSQEEPIPDPLKDEPIPGPSFKEEPISGPLKEEPIPGPSFKEEPILGPSLQGKSISGFFLKEEPIPGPSLKEEPIPDPPSQDEPIHGHFSQDEPMPGPSIRKADIVMLEAENYLLKMEVERTKEIIRTMRLHFSYTHICENDKLILEYTGLPNRKTFESLLSVMQDREIKYYLKWKVEKLSLHDQILITLMKLRNNFTHIDLAYRFNVSSATITNVMVTFTHLFHDVLFIKMMSKIPNRSKNSSCFANCASTFTNCRIILDCTEVLSAVPRQSMKHQKINCSAYMHSNTLKGLVGVAPNGVITYASNLFPGSSSDKMVVKSCGILNQIEPGDLILTGKGFVIKDILPDGVTVNIPPLLSTAQFPPEQVNHTECISKARIHVERAIKRMKSYKILSFIPVQLFKYSTIIFKTVVALTNLQNPLIEGASQFYTDSEAEN